MKQAVRCFFCVSPSGYLNNNHCNNNDNGVRPY